MSTTSADPGRALRALIALALLAPSTLLLIATSGPAHAEGQQLRGLFRIQAGNCSKSSISGTYFRMIQASGGTDGPYLANSDSPCSDQTFTPLGAGTDGGLSTTGYQSPPSPAFDKDGNATAGRITAPAKFYGTNFATGTAAKDAQTGTSVPVPSVTADGSRLSADLRAFSVTWNKQYFNQGAPKPNGGLPGNTRRATGTYDASTGHFTLDWTSQIQGGPFDGFTGKWHLEGTFVPAGGSTSGGTSGGAATSQGGGAAGTVPGTVGGAAAGGGVAGGTTVPGTAPRGTAPSAAVKGPHGAKVSPGASPSAGALSGAQPTAATTRTTTKPVWHVSWPVVGLAALVAVLGFISLIALRIAERRKGLS